MQAREILREAALKEKYGKRYNKVMTVLEKVGVEVTESVKEENQEVTNAIIEKLVDQRKLDLNISRDSDSSQAKSEKIYQGARQSERMKRIRAKISKCDLEFYDKWKRENIESKVPSISVPQLLLKLEQLEEDERREGMQKKSRKCARQLANPYESSWNHTQNILRAMRSCLLTRDWNGLTSVLLMLVTRRNSQIFFPTIKMMCEIMVEYNPLIEQLGLTDQFNELISHLVSNYKHVK